MKHDDTEKKDKEKRTKACCKGKKKMRQNGDCYEIKLNGKPKTITTPTNEPPRLREGTEGLRRSHLCHRDFLLAKNTDGVAL